jgi:hypothetical protein
MAAMRREVSLDTWRGSMLVLMAVAHLGGPLGMGVRYQLGFTSSAEGFVLLSGVMCGLVYSRYSRPSMRLMFERLWRRAATIYAYHVGVLLLLFGYVMTLAIVAPNVAVYFESSNLQLFLDRPLTGLGIAVLGLLLPENIGILGIYVVYVAVAPFILMQFIRGRVWLVFAISAAVWLFAQCGGSTALGRQLPRHDLMVFGSFDVFAWQAAFVAGCYVGWRRSRGEEILPWLGRPVFIAAAAAAAMLFVIRHWGPHLGPADLGGAMNLGRLGWLRIVNTAAIALAVYGAARYHSLEFRNGWLALLGAHSLQVFCFHAVAIYLAYPVLWRVHSAGLAADIAVTALFVASLGIPAVLHARIKAQSASRPAAA